MKEKNNTLKKKIKETTEHYSDKFENAKTELDATRIKLAKAKENFKVKKNSY